MAPFPQLRRPISRAQVRRELGQVWTAAGLPGGFALSWPAYMDERHRKNPRSYAEVRPDLPPAFAFADALRRLPPENRWALYAHEVGHVLDPEGSEDEADAAAEAALGVRIAYDHRWPGKGLQTLQGGTVRRNPRPLRNVKYGQTTSCESGIVFDDGFCSPRGELDYQPKDRFYQRCMGDIALTAGQDLGIFSAKELHAEVSDCSLSSVRNWLREAEKAGWVVGWAETRGLDKTGRRVYQLSEPGMDLAEWVRYRRDVLPFIQADTRMSDDDYFAEYARGVDPGVDPWDWTQDRDWTFSVQVEPPHDPAFDPWRFLAWSELMPEYPIGELVMFESGTSVFDTRQFGKVGPEDYAPVGRMRIHPAFRSAGVATALIEAASREAEKLGVALASSDARTPGQAAWWTAQVKKGRARKIRHRSRKHPEASRYLLRYPPPSSLALGKGKKPRQVEVSEGPAADDVPFNNPPGGPYSEPWWAELQQAPLSNPCGPCALLLL